MQYIVDTIVTILAGASYLAVSLALPLTIIGVAYIAIRLWRKKQTGSALKILLIIATVIVGFSLFLLLDILVGNVFPIR